MLASACKADKLALARLALQMPPTNPKAAESARAFMARGARMQVMQCPCCKANSLKVVATLAGLKHLPLAGIVMSGATKGAAMRRHASSVPSIQKFAPCQVVSEAVLRLTLACSNGPHGGSPVSGKVREQQSRLA